MKKEELNVMVHQFEEALASLDRVTAGALLREELKAFSPMEKVERIIVPALERIGSAWHQGRLALSQVYMSGRICEELVDSILPDDSNVRKDQPKIAVAVLQDHHMLGKVLVYSALRTAGFALQDLGRQEVGALIQRVAEGDIKILFISTLMLPSALRVADVKRGLAGRGLQVKIVVGGAPFRLDPDLWRDVGADAMGATASEAVTELNKMIGGAA